jgi:hypothetical protein
MSVAAALHRQVTAPVDPRAAGIARIGIGTAALLKAVLVAPVLIRLAHPDTLRLPLVAWLPEPGAPALVALLAVWALTAAAFCMGWRTRAAGCLLVGVMAIVLVLDQQTYSNHLYLLCILVGLLVLADGGAALSFDAARRGARRIPNWPLTLIRLQVSIVYGYAALAKLNTAFLSGGVLNNHLGHNAIVSVPDVLRTAAFMAPLAFGAIMVEMFLAFALWSDRLRRTAVIVGIAMHATFVLTIAATGELVVFGLVMASCYILFRSGATGAAAVPMSPPAAGRITSVDVSTSLASFEVRRVDPLNHSSSTVHTP